jgi:hypothetical protein
VQELVGGGPTQNQCSRLGRVETRRHADESSCRERAPRRIRSDDRQVGNAVAKTEVANTVAQLVYFADEVVSQHQRRPEEHGLRIAMATDQRIRELYTRGEHPHPHFTTAGSGHWRLGYLESIGFTETSDLNDPD